LCRWQEERALCVSTEAGYGGLDGNPFLPAGLAGHSTPNVVVADPSRRLAMAKETVAYTVACFLVVLCLSSVVAQASDAGTWAEAAIIGSGGLVGAFGAILTPADLVGMTGSELGAAIASGEIVSGWGQFAGDPSTRGAPQG